MNNKENMEEKIEAALNSADGAARATPKPFLYTRMMARMQRQNESAWETTGRFVARPSVIIAGLCLIISINALVVAYNNYGDTPSVVSTEQVAVTDELSTSVASLYYNENSEP